jgi:anti-anti-sigma regulatory factor
LFSKAHPKIGAIGKAASMLRITTIQNDGSPAVLKLEGKLLEPWIGELHEAYRKTCEHLALSTLDLAGLTYVDTPGTIALRDLRRRGIKLVGCSPLVAELLKETVR